MIESLNGEMEIKLSVRVSMIESLNGEMEIKTVQFECFVAARSSRKLQRTEKTSDPGMFLLWGPLTECDWQTGCCMWRMRAAVDLSDRET